MSRIERLQALLEDYKIEGLLVTEPANRRYLSGFTGSAGILLVTTKEARLITDFRYVEQAQDQAPECKIVQYSKEITATIEQNCLELNVKNLGFEKNNLTYAQYELYREKMSRLTLVPTGDLVEELRTFKEPEEIAAIIRAQELADEAFEHIIKFLRPGLVEIEVAVELECYMKKNGAEDRSFDFIVASGWRSCLPHGTATEKVLTSGDLLTMDFGAVYRGYHSDITRTVIIGEIAEAKQKEIYDIVLEAQLAALSGIRPGMEAQELDQLARAVIGKYGYGPNFGHGLGHGVGLAVHENPSISPKGNTVLEPGMVVTIEPGIYLPGWGGVRIEDMVVITESGFTNLTKSPKELMEL